MLGDFSSQTSGHTGFEANGEGRLRWNGPCPPVRLDTFQTVSTIEITILGWRGRATIRNPVCHWTKKKFCETWGQYITLGSFSGHLGNVRLLFFNLSPIFIPS
jgi:hypothetical protein